MVWISNIDKAIFIFESNTAKKNQNKQTKKEKKNCKKLLECILDLGEGIVFLQEQIQLCRYHKNFIFEVCYSTLSFEWSARGMTLQCW